MVKAITIYIIVIGLAASLWAVVPPVYYFYYGSPVPQPQLGQTVPIVVIHNKTVYITPEDSKVIAVGDAVAIGILGVSLFGLILLPVKRKASHAA
jgi:hypothetical protein